MGSRKKIYFFSGPKNKRTFSEPREKNIPKKMWSLSSRGGRGVKTLVDGLPKKITFFAASLSNFNCSMKKKIMFF